MAAQRVMVLLRDTVSMPSHRGAYCRSGVRLFCKKYNLDYNDLRTTGIPSDVLEALGDSMADRVIEAARERVRQEG